MKEIKRYKIEKGEHYLVYTGHEWSPSGYDLAVCYPSGSLVSQSNGDDLLKLEKIKIYELPETD